MCELPKIQTGHLKCGNKISLRFVKYVNFHGSFYDGQPYIRVRKKYLLFLGV
jgi:hypothetical protein